MKKHLIAAAVAGAFAVPATAQVTVYGVLSSGYSATELKATDIDAETYSRKSSSFGTQGIQSGSRLGFRGEEDLGGGRKAGFVYEMRADLNTGVSDTTNASTNARANSTRQAFVSVSGGFGEVRFGRGNSTSKDVYDAFNAHGGSGFAPGNNGQALSDMAIFQNDQTGTGGSSILGSFDLTNFGNTRHDNMVTYISPNLSGFRVTAQYAKNKVQNVAAAQISASALSAWPDVETTTSNFGIRYDSGPLSVAVAMDRTKTAGTTGSSFDGTSTKDTNNMVGASYTMGPAKVFFINTRYKDEVSATVETKVEDNTIGATFTTGAFTLIGSYSDGKIKPVGQATTGNSETKGYQLGVNYALSKRTMALARVGESEAKNKDQGSKVSVDGVAFGIQHSF